MDIKQAVLLAKQYITDLYEDESPSNLGLEEVEFDDKIDLWRVTIGFSRPWQTGFTHSSESRSFKLVIISDRDGLVKAVRNRVPMG